MAGLLVLTGLFPAPVLTVSFVLVGELAPAGTVTEAFAWLVTLMTSGMALGSAAVGLVLEHGGPSRAAGCGVVGLTVSALMLLAGQSRLAADRQADAPASAVSTA
ncbi:hypothetical protein [Streptomyces diastatochromogenes]|uniref:Major facilitator superfamily (MFS) profile domain-containing protein n=1 Tax=Streptomyces diastatochromogenes TaxID=42236 RepID=A0A233STU7_STRDA|nr:hypothetical protein [Streptomyces diastatochromogenes]MCZ0985924.1 hypothetical protein [Streptomyces diastatochromogenes]OXY99077.1 hypothetical protein BEK98_03605 [Streptomyces diastatochromogenes]